MELLTKTLILCLALTLTNADVSLSKFVIHIDKQLDAAADDGLPHRCDDIEFDAITPDEKGIMYFFKGAHLWRGFNGPAQLSNESFKELDDLHHIGHVDAAFRMHNEENVGDHDHIYFFLDNQVFSYYNHTLEAGYPKEITEDFPGVPDHLDAAAECPKGECTADSVLFFKGHDVLVYDITNKEVKTKTWPHLPICTSAMRWQEHYYCFHGHNFTRFHPVTGEVDSGYPKDARKYFMKCADHDHQSHWHDDIEFDAITPDEEGLMFLFKGTHLWSGDDIPAQLFNESFKELDDLHHVGHVDAAFHMHNEENDHIYFFRDNQVFSYHNHTLEAGYPKEITEDFPGVPDHLDAVVQCPEEDCTADSVLFFKGHDVHVYDIVNKTVKTKSWPHLPICTSAIRWQERYYCFHGHNFSRFHPVTGEVDSGYPKDVRKYFIKCADHGKEQLVDKIDFHLLIAAKLTLILVQGNPFPCQKNPNNNAYNIFVHRHIVRPNFNRQSKTDWQAYINQQRLCNRPVQTFIEQSDQGNVEQICTGSGYQVLHGRNLCISSGTFLLYDLTVDNNCIVQTLTHGTRPVVVACDKIVNQCRPSHFQRYANQSPDKSVICR
ncbi:hemopexin-like isoform X1 [Centropristis striata]|uniref:hemopexin-like isoform X1 n=1 Tax=Centropristis striata TaxID=184440 RepID=UPI0027E040C4|nr:hemopexin-like isoform X1 [Centropristis striata]